MAIDQYFEVNEKDDCVRFVGDKLEVYVPMRYEPKNYLVIGEKIQALAIFSMRINETTECGIVLPAVIVMDPSKTYETTIEGDKFFVCEFSKGDRFMCSLEILKNDKIGYYMWTEFLSLGNVPSFISYETILSLFDDVGETTGVAINVDHAVIEIVYAHLYRKKGDLSTYYRHTDMKSPPDMVSLRDVGYGPTTTHSRIIGAFAEEGRNAALLNQEEHSSRLEEYFRA